VTVTDYEQGNITGDIMFFNRPAGSKLIDRGDPAVYDFTVGNFIKDGDWHELDLSAIVPAAAIGVLLKLSLEADTAGSGVSFRKHGNVNNKNMGILRQPVADSYHEGHIFTFCDAQGKVDYMVHLAVWTTLSIAVRGWFKR